ncbi:MAG: HlyD family efflux transporter periplasmic adaptor subunit [Alphaproteobacteria bacterium]
MNDARKRRIYMWAGIGAVTVAAFAFAFWPRAVPVDMATIERGAMMVTLDEEGETRIHDIYTISAPIAGEITRIDAQPGDEVHANETLIAVIHPVEPGLLDTRTQSEREAQLHSAEAAVGAAEADVVSAKAQLDLAKSDLARARKLTPKNTISEQDLERLQNNVRVRNASLNAAEAALRARKADVETAKASLIGPTTHAPTPLDPVDVVSPVDGHVLRVLRKSEGVVAAAEPLVDIGDAGKLDAIVDYLSTDAVQIKAGDPVLIDDWGGGNQLKGHVERVEPYAFTKVSALGIEEQRANVIIDFDSPLEARARLGHGYRIQSHVIIWRSDNVVKVPLGGVFREGGKWTVFAVRNGRARLQNIEIGHMNTLDAEVVKGLAPGDIIIIHASERIKDGTLVVKRGT